VSERLIDEIVGVALCGDPYVNSNHLNEVGALTINAGRPLSAAPTKL